MGKLSLSYAGHLADRVRGLYDGFVDVKGIDLHFTALPPVEAFNRVLRGEFATGEMSFSTAVIRIARGDFPFVAIPVFPARTFRHGAIYVNSAAGIARPEDLIGRRVGVPEYGMTAAVWARGLLKHEYGVGPEDINWVTGGLTGPGRKPLVNLDLPKIRIEDEVERGLNDLLLEGAIDALIAPQVPPALLAGDPRLAYLFADVPAVEREYYKKTRIFPIMHTVVIRRDVYERDPWIAANLFEAFVKAKNLCLADLTIDEPTTVSVPWIQHHVAATKRLFGEDFWPYGVEPNRATIEALCRFLYEQEITQRLVGVDELFAETFQSAPARL